MMQDIDEVPSKLSFLKAEQAQFLQPFLTGEMFQTPIIFAVLHWTHSRSCTSLILRSSELDTAVLMHLTKAEKRGRITCLTLLTML